MNSPRNINLNIPPLDKYAYCLCLHVKPATIFIAIFKLVRSLLFASILLNSEISLNDHGSSLEFLDERQRSTVIAVNIFSRIIIASVAALAIYAVMYNRAALLMPLYAVLLVDFFFSLPFFYNRDLVDLQTSPAPIDEVKGWPDKPQLPRYSFMLFSTLSMLARIYFLCVIWKCYRYLRLIELVTPITREFQDNYENIIRGTQYPIVRVIGSTDSTNLGPSSGPGVGLAPPSYDSVALSMKPPNYEEAVKSDGSIYPITPSQILQHQQQEQQQQQQQQQLQAQQSPQPNQIHQAQQQGASGPVLQSQQATPISQPQPPPPPPVEAPSQPPQP